MKKLGFIGLVDWLNSYPCVFDASILHISGIETLPEQNEIRFSFKEGNITKAVILDILMTNPLRASICHIIEIQVGYNHWYSGKVTKEVTVQLKEK